MKKFDRLPPEQRKQEIQSAALALFREKGFAATTMENIVQQVSLSKGGVYRIYPSTAAVLEDLMLEGMRLRNDYYVQRVHSLPAGGLTREILVEMIVDSLLLYPEFSQVYVEFLWEKRRNPDLQALYERICRTTMEETTALIRDCGAETLLPEGTLERLTELMNAGILSLQVLGLRETFLDSREKIVRAVLSLLQM